MVQDRVEVRSKQPKSLKEWATTATVALTELAENGAEIDALLQMVQFMAQRLMELDVDGRSGAGYDEKATELVNSRNGYRDRAWYTSGRHGRSENSQAGAFLNRQIEGDWPYLWIGATYVKTREAGRIEMRGRDSGCGGQHRGPTRGAGRVGGRPRGRAVLDRVPAQPEPARAAWGQAGDQRHHEGIKAAASKAEGHLAALPSAHHAQCTGARGQDPAPRVSAAI